MKILRAMGLMLLMGLLPVSGAWAKNLAGFVIVSVGDVTAVDGANGQPRPLQRRSKIFEGDEIRTGQDAKVQLKFKDKGVIALEQNTALQITDYQFSGIEGQPERSFFKLVKGSFRAISGVIGKQNPDDYRMETPLATIGIRGTDYRAQLTSRLQVSVLNGAVEVSNRTGAITIGDGYDYRFAVVTDPGLSPQGLLELTPDTSVDDVSDETQPSEDEQPDEENEGDSGNSETKTNDLSGDDRAEDSPPLDDSESEGAKPGDVPSSGEQTETEPLTLTDNDVYQDDQQAPSEPARDYHDSVSPVTSQKKAREDTEGEQTDADQPEAPLVGSGEDDLNLSDTFGELGITDPGTTDPGVTDPGTTDPGTTDPGVTDPGTTDPGTTDPGITDLRITDTELTEISGHWGVAVVDKAPDAATEQSVMVGGLARDDASALPGLFVDKGLAPSEPGFTTASIVNVLRQGTHVSDQAVFARYDANVDTTLSGFSWGRWTGGAAELYTDPNNATSFTSITDDFYWFTGSPADMTAIPVGGQARFDRTFMLAGNGSSGPIIEEGPVSISIGFTLDWLESAVFDGEIRIVNGVSGAPSQQSHWSFKDLSGTFLNSASEPGAALVFGSVTGEVCVAQCSIPAPAIGDIKAFLLEGNQQIAGHFLFWESGNTAEWVSGVFAVGEDQRYTNSEVQSLDRAFFGVYQENPFESTLVTSSALMRGKSQAPTSDDFLMVDNLENPYGGVIRLGSGIVENDHPGGGTSLHGHAVDWGAWNGSTLATDFTGGANFVTEKYTWISFVPVEASIMDTLTSQISFSLPYVFYGWQYDSVAAADVPLQFERGYINVDLAADTLDGAFVFYGTGRFDVTFSGTTFGDGITVQSSLAYFNGSPVNISMDGEYIGSTFADGIAGGFKIGDPGNLDVYATGVYGFGRDERITSSDISRFTQAAYLSLDEVDSADPKVYAGLATLPVNGDFVFRDDVADGGRVISITSAISANPVVIGSIQVDWGSWDDTQGSAEIQDNPLDPGSVTPTDRAIAWVMGTPSDLADIPTTGISTYGLVAGFTGFQNGLPLSTPTTMSMEVDFASQTFIATMNVGASTGNWDMTYNGALTGNRLAGDGTGTWTDVANAATSPAVGVIQGAFVGTGSTTPVGAGPEGIMGTFKNQVSGDPLTHSSTHSSGAFVLQQ